MPPRSQKSPSTTKPDAPKNAPAEDQESDTTQAQQGEQYVENQGEGVRGSLPGEAPAAESTATTEGDGVNIVPGATGTVADPNDERLGTVEVKVNSNVTIGNEFYAVDPNKTVEVPNNAETQAAINAGHLTLADEADDEE